MKQDVSPEEVYRIYPFLKSTKGLPFNDSDFESSCEKLSADL